MIAYATLLVFLKLSQECVRSGFIVSNEQLSIVELIV